MILNVFTIPEILLELVLSFSFFFIYNFYSENLSLQITKQLLKKVMSFIKIIVNIPCVAKFLRQISPNRKC